MTVQELIDKLVRIKDKTVPVCISQPNYAMGSEDTGLYESGTILENITNVAFVGKDVLGGLDKLDKIDHVEIGI